MAASCVAEVRLSSCAVCSPYTAWVGAVDFQQSKVTIISAGAVSHLTGLPKSAQPGIHEHAAGTLLSLAGGKQQHRDAIAAGRALLQLTMMSARRQPLCAVTCSCSSQTVGI